VTNDAERVSDIVARLRNRRFPGKWSDELINDPLSLEAADIIEAQSKALAEARVTVSVKTMKLADGRADYYVSVMVGDREVTPHMFRILGRAEFEVENWKWLFGQGAKPNIMDWLDRTADPATPTPENPNG
jgi:hypothetical protein